MGTWIMNKVKDQVITRGCVKMLFEGEWSVEVEVETRMSQTEWFLQNAEKGRKVMFSALIF